MAENEPNDRQADDKPAQRKREGKICAECYPDGWQGDDVAATCEHGNWKR